jgi:hypothetical protein
MMLDCVGSFAQHSTFCIDLLADWKYCGSDDGAGDAIKVPYCSITCAKQQTYPLSAAASPCTTSNSSDGSNNIPRMLGAGAHVK